MGRLRGLFVQGVQSMQFMERDVIGMLRQQDEAQSTMEDTDRAVAIHAADPADVFGTVVPWPEVGGIHFTRKQGNFLVYHRGMWVCWLENYGRKIVFLRDDYNQNPGCCCRYFARCWIMANPAKSSSIRGTDNRRSIHPKVNYC